MERGAFSKTYAHAKKQSVGIVIATIISSTVATLIPMLQQHWADQSVSDQIAAVEARLQKQRDDDRADSREQRAAVWAAIRGISTKSSSIMFDPQPVTNKP